MICQQCRGAAELSREPEVICQYLNGRPQETLAGPEAAARWHGGCRGGTWCDCQHVVPVRGRCEALTLDA